MKSDVRFEIKKVVKLDITCPPLQLFLLPHIILFLGHGGDFVGDLLGG